MLLERAKREATRVGKRVLRPWRRRTRPHALILLYHRIAQPVSDPWRLCVSRENFRSHLEVLRRLCDIVPLAEIPRRLAPASARQRTPVAITFDDGYVDNLVDGLPELRRFDAPATVFLATGWIGRGAGFWWDRLASAVFDPSHLPQSVELPMLEGGFRWRRGPHDERTERRSLHRALWERCQLLPEDQREATLAALDAQLGESSRAADARPMQPDEVRQLHASGLVTIGAHTASHRPLPSLSIPEQESEITNSREACLALTGITPTSFAYPYGEVGDEAPRLVQQAGFALACSTVEELVWPGRDRFLLPRVSVNDLDATRFERWLRRNWLC